VAEVAPVGLHAGTLVHLKDCNKQKHIDVVSGSEGSSRGEYMSVFARTSSLAALRDRVSADRISYSMESLIL